MRKINKAIGLLLAVCMLVPFAPITANAGTTGVQIESGAIYEGEELSNADWYFIKNTGITLDKEGITPAVKFDIAGVGKVLTAYKEVVMSEEVENGLTVSFTLSLSEIVEGNKFGLAFGSPRLLSEIEEVGTTFLWFAKEDGAFTYGVTAYGELENKELVGETTIPNTQASGFDIRMSVTTSGKLILAFDEATVYESNEENEVNGNGFIAFAHQGEESLSGATTQARVMNLNILNEYYAKPATPETTRESFDNNEFNTQEWHLQSSTAYTGGLFAKNESLVFEHVGQNSAFAAKHEYSNFHLEFNVSDVLHEGSVADNGWTVQASCWLGVEFGREAADAGAIGSPDWAYLLYFDGLVDGDGNHGNVTNMGFLHGKEGYISLGNRLPDKYAFMNRGFTDEVRVKVTVIDGELNVYVKLTTEYEWYKLYSYAFEKGYTPKGFVSFRGMGNQFIGGRTYYQSTSLTVDDILLMNCDKEPNLVNVGFTSNIMLPTKDFEFIDTWTDDYLISFTKGKGTKKIEEGK